LTVLARSYKAYGYRLWVSEDESESVVIHAENVHAALKEFNPDYDGKKFISAGVIRITVA